VFYVCSIGNTMGQEIKKLEKEGMMRCEEFISVSEILFSNVSIKHIWTKQKMYYLKQKKNCPCLFETFLHSLLI